MFGLAKFVIFGSLANCIIASLCSDTKGCDGLPTLSMSALADDVKLESYKLDELPSEVFLNTRFGIINSKLFSNEINILVLNNPDTGAIQIACVFQDVVRIMTITNPAVYEFALAFLVESLGLAVTLHERVTLSPVLKNITCSLIC